MLNAAKLTRAAFAKGAREGLLAGLRYSSARRLDLSRLASTHVKDPIEEVAEPCGDHEDKFLAPGAELSAEQLGSLRSQWKHSVCLTLGCEVSEAAYDSLRQQYERQWRMACDPLREKESKEILKATHAARAYQIGEKMKSLELDEQENRAFDAMWESDRLAKLGREEAEDDARRQMDLEHKLVLDKQVAELHTFRTSEKQLAMDEAALLRVQWEAERAEAKKPAKARPAPHDRVAKLSAKLSANGFL